MSKSRRMSDLVRVFPLAPLARVDPTARSHGRDSSLKPQAATPKATRRTTAIFISTTFRCSNESIDENTTVAGDARGEIQRGRAVFYRAQYVTRALNSGYVVASDHVAIDLDQGYQLAISDPLI